MSEQKNKMVSWDDEIDLFDSQEDWGYMDNIDVSDETYEYFGDVVDGAFEKTSFFKSDTFIMIAFIVILVLGMAIGIIASGILDREEYNKVLGMQSMMQSANVQYVEGEEVSSEALVQISNTLGAYFDAIAADDIKSLNKYCNGSSNFADTYNQTMSKIQTIYDPNDCYARMLRKFAGFCHIGKIERVIKSDGYYYCYFNFQYPNEIDVSDYIGLISFDMNKWFSSNGVSDANVVRFMNDITTTTAMQCHNEIYCIKFVQKDGKYVLADDIFLTSICTSAYNDFLIKVTNQLGEGYVGQKGYN